MPVWQQFYERHHKRGVDVLAIAMDSQGGDRVRPYIDAAGVTFPVAIDSQAVTGQLYGFKHVGHGFLVNTDGKLSYVHGIGFDVRLPDVAQALEQWAIDNRILTSKRSPSNLRGAISSGADALFQDGLRFYQGGDHKKAVFLWRSALKMEPDSVIIHRHIWAVENPDRFYDGEIDQIWKRQQIMDGL